MARVTVDITVTGSGDVMDELDRLTESMTETGRRSYHLEVRKNPDCCPRCRENEDPHRVPYHPNCRCWVVIVDDEDGDESHFDLAAHQSR